MFHWLNTVSFKNLQPQTLIAMLTADALWGEEGYECWVTSCNDGVHGGEPVEGDSVDPHFAGKAVDIRIKNVLPDHRGYLVGQLKTRLGPQYVVLWESKGTGNEHVHVQFGHVKAA